MGIIMASLVGYVVGTRAGRAGMGELVDGVEAIVTCDEVRALAVTGLNLIGGPLRDALLPRADGGQGSSPVVEIAMGVLSGLSRRAA